MSLKDDLIAAKALVNRPGTYARKGALGALMEACKSDEDYRSARDALKAAVLPGTFKTFNPVEARHADIMALFDRAIEAAP